eukprot:780475-Prorocentrum_minimum.AAC.1
MSHTTPAPWPLAAATQSHEGRGHIPAACTNRAGEGGAAKTHRTPSPAKRSPRAPHSRTPPVGGVGGEAPGSTQSVPHLQAQLREALLKVNKPLLSRSATEKFNSPPNFSRTVSTART